MADIIRSNLSQMWRQEEVFSSYCLYPTRRIWVTLLLEKTEGSVIPGKIAPVNISLWTVKLAFQLGRRRVTTGGVPSGVR